MVKEDVVVIDRRFNGPPGWANGGYACGLLAEHLGGVTEVTLRRPVPLATSLGCRSRAPVDALPPGRLQKLRTTSGFEIGVSAYVLLAGACALLVLTHVSNAISL